MFGHTKIVLTVLAVGKLTFLYQALFLLSNLSNDSLAVYFMFVLSCEGNLKSKHNRE